MVQYSKEFLQEYLSSEWLSDYNLVSDEGYTEEEIETLYQKAVAFELEKCDSKKKRIDLPATAYLKLDQYEKAYKKNAEKQLATAKPLADFLAASETEDVFGGWGFHDFRVLSIAKKGRELEIRLRDPYSIENPYVLLRLSGVVLLENEIPFQMYFEDFNYNAGTDHLFYTTVEYDFTSEDGERYYIDYHEGKLEEYLNVREMQPGGKYMLLYDVKSGQVLDVKTLE